MLTPCIFFTTLLTASAFAQDASIVNPTTAAPSATALAASNGYTYAGCWNETVGVANAAGARALSGGMTGRECYCGAYLSALSEKLNESARCIYACDGNSSQVCGGALALTLYNLTSESKTGIAWSLATSQPAWYSAGALIMLIVAAVL